ncbi:MAG: hypothetical protein DME26_09630 [Verrucomicrobia bacterium]|nr:MAG: hypothetical protein DME26_09630 [Verrucomicrobiota bacterium]
MPGSTPYIFSVSGDSFVTSINSGALDCIRKAISKELMRVAISGSPITLRCSSLRFLIKSSVRRCILSVMPAGLERNSTGSPVLRNGTP